MAAATSCNTRYPSHPPPPLYDRLYAISCVHLCFCFIAIGATPIAQPNGKRGRMKLSNTSASLMDGLPHVAGSLYDLSTPWCISIHANRP